MEISHRKILLTGLLLALGVLQMSSQVQSPGSAKTVTKDKKAHAANSTKVHAQPKPVPQTIQVGNTEMALTDIVPSTEAAQDRLQQVLGRTKDPTLRNLQQALEALSNRVARSKDETLYLVRNARSNDQIAEARTPAQRDRQQLENLSSAVQSYVQLLTEEQRQVSTIEQKWSLPSQSASQGAVLPEGLLDRIQQVRETASEADAAVRSTLESLVQLQVQISEERKVLDDLLQQIDASEKRLRQSVFALDSPPLWSALRGSSYASLKGQARVTLIAARSRTTTFYLAYHNGLLAYFAFFLVLTAIFHRLRRDLERQAIRQKLESPRIFQRPFSLAAFTLLFLFGVFFSAAPPEVLRISRLLLILPSIRIALAVFDSEIQIPVTALGVFYALDVMTGHVAAGTLLRRLLVLFLAVSSLMGVAWLLRTASSVQQLFARKHWTTAGLFARFALISLAASAVSNLVGTVWLADVLMHGAVRSIYSAMVVYLMYVVASGLIVLLTVSRFGQVFRMVRLHRELVLNRVHTVLKLASWIAWFASVLISYDAMQPMLAGFRDALTRKWTIGATSFSVGDIVLFFLILTVASSIARVIRFFLEEEILPRTTLSSGVAQSSSRLAYYTLVLIGVFLALAAAGLNLSRFTVLTGAFGVGLGFGLQNLVGNFVSGIIISLERPMQLGDVIGFGNLQGKVTHIGFRSTTVKSEDGAEVMVPNSDLVTKAFVKWSLTHQQRRGELRVGVAYGTDPARVIAILGAITGSHPAVLKSPATLITFERFGENALEFYVRFWTWVDQLESVRSELNVRVAEQLAKNEIVVPLPQRDVHLHMAKTTADAVATENAKH